MGDYIIFRRGIIQQTLLVRDAESKADAIRKVSAGVEPLTIDGDGPVTSMHWDVERWHHSGQWLVEEEPDPSPIDTGVKNHDKDRME